MVDYNEEAHRKHEQMQRALADLRQQTNTFYGAPSEETSSATATSETLVASTDATPSPAGDVRLVTGSDAFTLEVLDRTYTPIRQTFMRLAPRTEGYVTIRPPDRSKYLVPKAWSFRVRDADDPALRRTISVREITIDDVRQMRIDPGVGIDTDELEADYYRMALEGGKEATLVARDISSFAIFTFDVPLVAKIFNPCAWRPVSVLVRVWGEQKSL